MVDLFFHCAYNKERPDRVIGMIARGRLSGCLHGNFVLLERSFVS